MPTQNTESLIGRAGKHALILPSSLHPCFWQISQVGISCGSYFACGGIRSQSLVAVIAAIFFTTVRDFLIPQVIIVFAWQGQHFKA